MARPDRNYPGKVSSLVQGWGAVQPFWLEWRAQGSAARPEWIFSVILIRSGSGRHLASRIRLPITYPAVEDKTKAKFRPRQRVGFDVLR
jgi:hypothetical protein